jgi:hypothetical protein
VSNETTAKSGRLIPAKVLTNLAVLLSLFSIIIILNYISDRSHGGSQNRSAPIQEKLKPVVQKQPPAQKQPQAPSAKNPVKEETINGLKVAVVDAPEVPEKAEHKISEPTREKPRMIIPRRDFSKHPVRSTEADTPSKENFIPFENTRAQNTQ